MIAHHPGVIDDAAIVGLWQAIKKAFGGERIAPEPEVRTPQQHFAELFRTETLRNPRVTRVEPNPDADFSFLVWAHGVENPWTTYLGNLFAETRELSPEAKLERIRAFLAGFADVETPDWDDVQPLLVPVVRLSSLALGSPAKLTSKQLTPGLSIFVVIDQDTSMAYVGEKQLSQWGVPPDVVYDAAVATLANHVQASDVEIYDPDASYPIWHVTSNDSYESSRLALPGFLASFRGKVDGTPIAIVPERSTLIISGDGNPDAVARLARLAEQEFQAAPRAISPCVYTVDEGGTVRSFHLPESHPHHHAVESGHTLLAATIYKDQEEELRKRFETDGVDIFVAGFRMSQNTETGKVVSWAVMPEGVDTLLPKVDLIALCGGEGDAQWKAMVPWQTVFDLASACLALDETFDPPRWRTVGWPEAQVLTQLREASVL